tara:strand:+ start:130 stop:354 length:225 start_codon:yes stop_codon:yes gene_type:complete
MLAKYFSFPFFIVSLAIGLLFVYLSVPAPTVIYVYPTPDNVKDLEYKDKSGSCFQFDAQQVSCTEEAKTIPIQN